MSQDLDARRKRLIYQSWHRGNKETDLIFGPFADQYLKDFTAEQLDRYEALLGNDDLDLFEWFSGKREIPDEFKNDIWDLVSVFKPHEVHQRNTQS